jgi:hypothetical protein
VLSSFTILAAPINIVGQEGVKIIRGLGFINQGCNHDEHDETCMLLESAAGRGEVQIRDSTLHSTFIPLFSLLIGGLEQ